MLGVSVDKDEKAYKRFLSRVNVSFLTARDPDNKINAEYGTFKFPETYIINRDGKVLLENHQLHQLDRRQNDELREIAALARRNRSLWSRLSIGRALLSRDQRKRY